jgi:hypothetical protein
MVTEQEAIAIATGLLGRSPEDPGGPWELVGFDEGWLIREHARSDSEPHRGGAARVIERDTGRVVRFPSSVPPGRILSEYSQVQARGRVESPGA